MSLGERGAFTSDQPAGIDIVPNDTAQNLGGAFSGGTARWTFLNLPTLARSMGILSVYVANATASTSGLSSLTIPFPTGSQPTGAMWFSDGVSNSMIDLSPVTSGGIVTGLRVQSLGNISNQYEQFTVFFMI